MVAPLAVVEAGNGDNQNDAGDKILELAAHEEICVAMMVADRVRLACA